MSSNQNGNVNPSRDRADNKRPRSSLTRPDPRDSWKDLQGVAADLARGFSTKARGVSVEPFTTRGRNGLLFRCHKAGKVFLQTPNDTSHLLSTLILFFSFQDEFIARVNVSGLYCWYHLNA